MLLTSDVQAVVAALAAAKAEGGRRMDVVVDNAGFELVRFPTIRRRLRSAPLKQVQLLTTHQRQHY
jgi:hypothetical protein